VILDRTFDLITPLIHDYQYQSAIFEYLPVTEDCTLDEVIKPQKSKQRQAASEKSHKLDEKDEIWQKYKNMHIAEVYGGLNDEIRMIKED
jgi:syntaxin-binding protein 1